jgi:hypothetical protein
LPNTKADGPVSEIGLRKKPQLTGTGPLVDMIGQAGVEFVYCCCVAGVVLVVSAAQFPGEQIMSITDGPYEEQFRKVCCCCGATFVANPELYPDEGDCPHCGKHLPFGDGEETHLATIPFKTRDDRKAETLSMMAVTVERRADDPFYFEELWQNLGNGEFVVWDKDGTIVIEDPDAEDADKHGFRNIPHEEAVEEMVAELWGRCEDDEGEFEFYRSLLGVCGEDEPTD